MGAMTLNVRLNGPLADHVGDKVGPAGRYENVSEYVRDLIRRELEREEAVAFAELKAELRRAFSTPDEAYTDWNVEAFLAEPVAESA